MTAAPQQIPVRVTEVASVTALVKRFRLVALDGSLLPAFSGGAHVTVEIRDGDIVWRNAYSLMSSPNDVSCYEISVRRDEEGRGGSRLLHERVAPGAVLRISHPLNLFPIDRRARKHLMIAGGIGITPFLAMTRQLALEGALFELHYAVRSGEHAPYADALRERCGDRVTIYAGDRGERLPIDALLARQVLGTHLYVCGPTRLTEACRGRARAIGWPATSVHSEHFTAPIAGNAFDARLERSGVVVSVGPHQSMLEAIEAKGIEPPSLCRGGACGQCETRVLACDGTLLHADHYLTVEEKASGGVVMLCVSRFDGRSLVLDL